MKLDLQMHSTYSDGYNTPEELIKLAHDTGVNIISITEHDNLDSFQYVQDACISYNVQAISGVEISTKFEGKVLHFLGYNIDTQHQGLIDFLNSIVEYRKERIIAQIPILNNNLQQAGKQGVDAALYATMEKQYFTMPGLALFMKEQGIINHKNEGFDFFTGIKSTVPDISPQQAFDIIHQAGGKAYFAHPIAPKISLKDLSTEQIQREYYISLFAEQGMDGIEAISTGHTPEEQQFCIAMADKYNLAISAGSDWHGPLESIDHGIKKYLPYYLSSFGTLQVDDTISQRIIKGLGL